MKTDSRDEFYNTAWIEATTEAQERENALMNAEFDRLSEICDWARAVKPVILRLEE